MNTELFNQFMTIIRWLIIFEGAVALLMVLALLFLKSVIKK